MNAGNPQDPAEIVKDALEQYPDLPDEEIVGVGPEDYILRRLHQAGYLVVRRGSLRETYRRDRGLAP